MFISLLGRRRAGLSCTRTIERGRSGQVLRGGGMEGNPTPELAVGIPDELGEAVVDASASCRPGALFGCSWGRRGGVPMGWFPGSVSLICPVHFVTDVPGSDPHLESLVQPVEPHRFAFAGLK